MKKFIINSEDDEDIEYVVSPSTSLEQIIEYLDFFLKSSGYKYYGNLDIFPHDDGK